MRIALKTIINVLSIFLYLIIIILALELGVRLVLRIRYSAYFNRYIAAKYHRGISEIENISARFDNEIVMDPICYYTMRGGFFRGPRGQFNPPDKEEDEIRVICVGDSTTFGAFLDYYSSYPVLLEKLLRSKYPEKKIRVLNSGIPGASSCQVKRVFQLYLINHEPDIVIWRKGPALTDTYEVSPISKYRMSLWNFLYQSKLFRVIFILADRIYPQQTPAFEKAYNYIMGTSNDAELEYGLNSNFDIVKKIAFKNKAKHVLAVDFIYRFPGREVESDYKSYTEKHVKPLLITFDSFEEALRSNEIDEIFVDECHMTETGATIIADEVFKFIVDNKWITE